MKKLSDLKTQFNDKKLLDQALTHRSWLNENLGIRESNERLEFLGDAILEFVVSETLYRKFTKRDEGFLTALRANLVNTKNLAKIAKHLEIGPAIFMSKGETDAGGHANESLLADTVEAIIGAIYLDGGLSQVTNFVKDNLLFDLDEKAAEPLKDPKSLLQEKVQAMGKQAPVYRVTKEVGPDHARAFTVQVKVADVPVGVGSGKSKSEAQQEAAKAGLESLASKG